MTIPVGYAQANFFMGGSALPTGAQCTLGVNHTAYTFSPDQMASDLATAWETEIMPYLVNTVQLEEVRVKLGPDDLGPVGVFVGTAVGGDTSGAASPNTAILVRKNTAAGGRPNRGRMYVPGVDETQVDQAGVLAGGYLSTLQSAAAGLQSVLESIDLPPVLLHGENSPVATPTPITSMSVDPRVATQRRRLRR